MSGFDDPGQFHGGLSQDLTQNGDHDNQGQGGLKGQQASVIQKKFLDFLREFQLATPNNDVVFVYRDMIRFNNIHVSLNIFI